MNLYKNYCINKIRTILQNEMKINMNMATGFVKKH